MTVSASGYLWLRVVPQTFCIGKPTRARWYAHLEVRASSEKSFGNFDSGCSLLTSDRSLASSQKPLGAEYTAHYHPFVRSKLKVWACRNASRGQSTWGSEQECWMSLYVSQGLVYLMHFIIEKSILRMVWSLTHCLLYWLYPYLTRFTRLCCDR